jgi:hypothetical protein
VTDLIKSPWHATSADFQRQLTAKYPPMVLPSRVRAQIGQGSVDVMPWESSLAVVNGLNLHQRPVPQSYSAYTPWLDGLNAAFLDSAAAPDCVLYTCAQPPAIDNRPSAWDESITKRAFLENYTFTSEFTLPLLVQPEKGLQPAPVYLLQRTPSAARFVAVRTNQVSMMLGEPLVLPPSTNLLYLTLKLQSSWRGKLRGALISPVLIMVNIKYADGRDEDFRAVPPILETGVLVNRRVESPDEIRHWLQREAGQNPAVTSLCFRTYPRSNYQMPCSATLTEYRLETVPGNPSPR